MDLRSKLELLKNLSNNNSSANVSPEKSGKVKTEEQIVEELGGRVIINSDGNCVLVENCYYSMYLHGGFHLLKAREIDLSKMELFFPGISELTDISKYLFLDTETTGLSGGTGTVAFLVGIGYFSGDIFCIKQFFMSDYDEEPSMLRALSEIFSNYEGLVTFNGKCFDWNLLTTRFSFNRIRMAMDEPVHVDLLFPARRLWKDRLESCSLSSLEENILCEFRTGDIPGSEIPAAYFKFLEDRNTDTIRRIMEHNRNDILSMVSLLIRISEIVNNPFDKCIWEEELFSLGRIYFRSGEYDKAHKCLEKCTESGNTILRDKAARLLAYLYKREGNYPMAVSYWTDLACRKSISSMIELAKFYEHKEKNIKKALEIVEEALDLLRITESTQTTRFDDLKKRYDRLKRKERRL
mgnify:CR=1 FL=1